MELSHRMQWESSQVVLPGLRDCWLWDIQCSVQGHKEIVSFGRGDICIHINCGIPRPTCAYRHRIRVAPKIWTGAILLTHCMDKLWRREDQLHRSIFKLCEWYFIFLLPPSSHPPPLPFLILLLWMPVANQKGERQRWRGRRKRSCWKFKWNTEKSLLHKNGDLSSWKRDKYNNN